MGLNDINSLSHSKWNCKYHIVFAPKYRRRVFYKDKKRAIGEILRKLCEWKGVNIIESEVYTYVGRDTAKILGFEIYGIFER